MPIYEYQCAACAHQFEALQKMSEAPLTECPACHQPSLNKLISAAGFQLKGTGWYVTDYSKKNKPKAGGESSTDSGSATDSSGGATDSTQNTSTENKNSSSNNSSSSAASS